MSADLWRPTGSWEQPPTLPTPPGRWKRVLGPNWSHLHQTPEGSQGELQETQTYWKGDLGAVRWKDWLVFGVKSSPDENHLKVFKKKLVHQRPEPLRLMTSAQYRCWFSEGSSSLQRSVVSSDRTVNRHTWAATGSCYHGDTTPHPSCWLAGQECGWVNANPATGQVCEGCVCTRHGSSWSH